MSDQAIVKASGFLEKVEEYGVRIELFTNAELFDDDEGFRLQPAQIQRMLGSAELQALFKQRRMRDIIRLVDGGHVSLDKAREEDPDFMRMTIKLLEAINPEGPPQ